MFSLFISLLLLAVGIGAWWTKPKPSSSEPRPAQGEDEEEWNYRRRLEDWEDGQQRNDPTMRINIHRGVAWVANIAAIGLFISLSIVAPSGGQVGLIEAKLLCTPNERGTYLAREGECGRQADMFMPGLKIPAALPRLQRSHLC